MQAVTVLPKHLRALLGAYFLATIAHFSHNAEYLAFYPGMPGWLTRETVYLAWLAMTSVGVSAIVALRFGWIAPGGLLLGAYGALGLDALTHYAVALCADHSWAANLTIWLEATAGTMLAVAAARFLVLRR